MALTNFSDKIKNIFDQEYKLHGAIRAVIILGGFFRFITNPLDRLSIYWVLAVLAFAIYTLMIYIFWNNHYFSLLKIRKWITICLDIFFVSLLYSLTRSINSEFYLFFYLPILVAADLFSRENRIPVFIFIAIGFTGSVLITGFSKIDESFSSFDLLFRTLLPRLIVFLLVLFVSFMKSSLLREKSEIMTALSLNAIDTMQGDTIEKRLNAIMDTAISLLGASGSKVYLYRPTRMVLELVSIKGVDSHLLQPGYTMGLNKGMAGAVFFNRMPLIVNEYSKYPRKIPELEGLFKAVIEAPIYLKDIPLGVIAVLDDKKGRKFTKADSTLLLGLIPYLANAINEIHSLEEIRLQSRVLMVLNQAGQEINTNLDIERTYYSVTEYAWKLANLYHQSKTSFAYFCTYHEDSSTLEFVATYPEDNLEKMINRVGTIDLRSDPIGIIGLAVQTSSSARVDDVENEETYIKFEPDTKSQLSVPVFWMNNIIGVISVEHSDQGAFPLSLQKNMEVLANQAASAIQNAILFSKNNQQYTQMKELYESFGSIKYRDGLKKVSESILDNLYKVLPFSRATLQLFRDTERKIIATHSLPEHDIDYNLVQSLVKDPFMEEVISLKRIVILSPPYLHPGWKKSPTTADIETWVCIPFISENVTIGIITADFDKQYFIPDKLKILLEIFAAQAASMINNATLFENNKNQLDKIIISQEHLKRVLEYFDERQNLINIGLVYGEDIHYAKSRLGLALSRASRILKDKSPYAKKAAGEIIEYIESYLHKLMEIQEQVVAKPTSVLVDLNKLLKDIESMKYQSLWNKLIKVEYWLKAKNSVVMAPEKQLRQVFLVLLQNAIDAIEEKADGKIIISINEVVHERRQYVKVSVTDNGKGIPPELQGKLFRYRLKSNELGRSGMGLVWARSFMRSFQGRGDIEFETTVGVGTTMIVLVPRDFGASIFSETKFDDLS